MDGVTGLVSWGSLGPWGIVAIFFMLVFLGLLIPYRVHNKVVKDKDDLIKTLQAALDKRDAQFEKLFEQNELIVDLLEDIKQASSQRTGRP